MGSLLRKTMPLPRVPPPGPPGQSASASAGGISSVVTWNISPAPSQSLAVMSGVCMYWKFRSCRVNPATQRAASKRSQQHWVVVGG